MPSDYESYTVAGCIDNLNALGYALNKKYSLVEAQYLAELVALMEETYDSAHAMKSIQEDKVIEYRQLHEYYRVGDLVKAPQSSLGSAVVCYRVCDAYYELKRSMMGQRKLSFHLGLEYIATIGDAYAFVAFEYIVGDWEQAQSLDKLHYQRIEQKSTEVKQMTERGLALLSLGLEPTYRSYRGACFFAHGGAKGAHMSENGRLVVDTTRGLQRGHLVARGKDEECLAYQLLVKAYRSVQRARADGMTLEKMQDQLKKQGLRLMSTVPAGQGVESTSLSRPPAVSFRCCPSIYIL